ncbi:MAG: hypothetical protein EYC70_13525 [Planctomycetota bacterium]|nr:MAG: hypothetical protein EYC70_13525 [Planctomycetota bacterium]
MIARCSLALAALLGLASAVGAQTYTAPGPRGPMAVVGTQPASVSSAPVTTTVRVLFDRAVDLASVDAASFRVFGRHSGAARGAYALIAGGLGVEFTPDDDFSAGEVVWVNLARTIRGLDGTRLRAAGYAFQFGTEVQPSGGSFTQYAVLSNNHGEQTRIYGAAGTDLNHDGYPDLTTVNEVSADLRVFLNLADGTGNYGPFLPPEPIGDEASPNATADFDNDGDADICAAASSSEDVWILLGSGDGSFGPAQSISVGQEPHGIAALDVDGDADFDIVNCNNASNNLSLMLNDGSGVFGPPSFFDGGVDGEYGLAAGDMDHDGIADLVVAGRDGSHVRTLRGNGNGTFTPAGAAQGSGGQTWVVTLGDVDGDGDLDASTANSTSGTAGILKNTGTGVFKPVSTVTIGAHTVSTDLGDLDGDGDLDWAVSSFGGGFWRFYRNDGSGSFAFWFHVTAPSNPSCAILLDTDNDGDLDLALTDEIADVVVLMKNN